MSSGAQDVTLALDTLRAQLTRRTEEVMDLQAANGRLEAKVRQLEATLRESERQTKEMLETNTRMSKEREAMLQGELTARDAEVARLKNVVAQTQEASAEVERECEAQVKAKAAQLNAMRSRCDDIVDNFAEMLQGLSHRMQKAIPLVAVAPNIEDKGETGLSVKSSAQILTDVAQLAQEVAHGEAKINAAALKTA